MIIRAGVAGHLSSRFSHDAPSMLGSEPPKFREGRILAGLWSKKGPKTRGFRFSGCSPGARPGTLLPVATLPPVALPHRGKPEALESGMCWLKVMLWVG